MTNAVLFDRYMDVHQAADNFYKKNVMVLRGSFRPITYVGFDMLKTGFGMFKKDIDYNKKDSILFCEISLDNLLKTGDFDEKDFLDRVDILCGMGMNVMVSNFKQHHEFVSYFSEFRIKKLGIIIGVMNLKEVFDEKYYEDLNGGIMQGLGKLFSHNVKLYVYPAKSDNGDIVYSKDVIQNKGVKLLYTYLVNSDKIVDIENVNTDKLDIYSIKVLEMINNGDPKWEKMLPRYVMKRTKNEMKFGYKIQLIETYLIILQKT